MRSAELAYIFKFLLAAWELLLIELQPIKDYKKVPASLQEVHQLQLNMVNEYQQSKDKMYKASIIKMLYLSSRLWII
ncbi:hypothetical protein [Cytobacillus sp. FSL R5-0596]|uniref:hypothetical protein n=1 Tax=Cytobacillus sp. FSL R5-0596 TaxID=2954696 RepID=UPI0030FD1D9B